MVGREVACNHLRRESQVVSDIPEIGAEYPRLHHVDDFLPMAAQLDRLHPRTFDASMEMNE